jgi:glucose-6-phosphate dehydrogenase assembly protein OpcA
MKTDIEPGIPVEIGKIEKELGKLWESSDDTKTRASLINFVIYSRDPESVAADTEIISAIAGKHACRAILILANPEASTSGAKAWINAHCHVLGKSQRQICSEQITFRLDGESALELPSIVFSHLDSDLPLCLWWKGELPEPLDDKLWSWVDRLIFDSGCWPRPAHQFSIMRHISSQDESSTVLCDLNWTRLHTWRYAFASLFDHASAFPCLARVDSITINSAPEARTAALLLLGWFASRLKWTAAEDGCAFVKSDKRRVSFAINEKDGPSLSSVSLKCEGAQFDMTLAEGSNFFEALIHAPGIPDTKQLFPAPQGSLVDTLLAELSRAGRHPLYTKSLEIILPILDR